MKFSFESRRKNAALALHVRTTFRILCYPWDAFERMPVGLDRLSCMPAFRWLRAEAGERKMLPKKSAAEYLDDRGELVNEAGDWSNGWAAGRMTSTMRDSTNAVMRL